ncbi:hypothetical protein M8J77_009463 [Diaphorina citri]|nr:hypothetical protein M8J77_009463 [Diaphorina citri]
MLHALVPHGSLKLKLGSQYGRCFKHSDEWLKAMMTAASNCQMHHVNLKLHLKYEPQIVKVNHVNLKYEPPITPQIVKVNHVNLKYEPPQLHLKLSK